MTTPTREQVGYASTKETFRLLDEVGVVDKEYTDCNMVYTTTLDQQRKLVALARADLEATIEQLHKSIIFHADQGHCLLKGTITRPLSNEPTGANNMNASQLFADINTGGLTEVAQAANSYYDQNRGLTVRQSFYVYPDDTIVALNYVDGGYQTLTLSGDDAATFSHLYLRA